MRGNAVLVAVALAGAAAAPARADADADDGAEAAALAAEAAPHAELGLGLLLGTFHAGPVASCVFGLALDPGVRAGRLSLLADYEWVTLTPSASPGCRGPAADPAPGAAPLALTHSATQAITGNIQRYGVIARYSVAKIIDVTGGAGDAEELFVQAGASDEVLARSADTALHRLDVHVGAGTGVQVRDTTHHGGVQVGVRADLEQPFEGSRRPDIGGSIFILGDFGG